MIINEKELALKVQETLKEQISKFETKPCLSIIQVGENPASTIYVNNKIKACENVGLSLQGTPYFISATARGICEILNQHNSRP